MLNSRVNVYINGFIRENSGAFMKKGGCFGYLGFVQVILEFSNFVWAESLKCQFPLEQGREKGFKNRHSQQFLDAPSFNLMMIFLLELFAVK
jgi:hypothetical protein